MSPVTLRQATPQDLPDIATLSTLSFTHDPLYSYTNPWRLSHPTSFRNFFLRRARERFWTPGWVFVVAEVSTDSPRDQKQEGREGGGGEEAVGEVVGYACWRRSGHDAAASRWTQDSWTAKLERRLTAIETTYVTLFGLDRSLSHANQRRWRECTAEVMNDIADPEKRLWVLQTLCVHPEFTRRGIGGELVKWGMERAREEDVQVGLTSSPMARGLYVRLGFEVRRVLDTPFGPVGVLVWRAGEEGDGDGDGEGGGKGGGREGEGDGEVLV